MRADPHHLGTQGVGALVLVVQRHHVHIYDSHVRQEARSNSPGRLAAARMPRTSQSTKVAFQAERASRPRRLHRQRRRDKVVAPPRAILLQVKLSRLQTFRAAKYHLAGFQSCWERALTAAGGNKPILTIMTTTVVTISRRSLPGQ
mmetsp:Transcript_64567/g.207936  ORF Transcript_64567/g.207936 Transcript_64567/m.207936 type:complete len:146 (+) Transcript_64567:199-636(+)